MTKSRQARRSRRDRRAVLYEALESRHLLSVTFTDDETPPYNDSLANAQSVVSPGLSAGVVDMINSPSGTVVTGDPDYYKFQAAVAGDLKISVGYTGGTSNATVTFYDNSDNQMGSSTVIDSLNPTAGLSVLTVNIADVYKVGIVGNDAQYQLRIWNSDVNDDSTGSPADNNSMNVTSATFLGAFNGTAINTPTYTITRPDRDYFRMISNVAGPVEVRAIMPAGTGAATGANGPTNLGLRVRNSSGVILATSNGTTTDVDLAVFQAVNAQTYYIELYSGSVGQVNEYNLQITQPTATVTGFKYLDSNLNGFQDWGEPGLQGWTIYVDADNSNTLNGVEASVPTAADGSYSLTLPPGTHVIREVIPVATPPWLQTYPGADFGDEHTIEVSASMVLDHIDFGNFQGVVKSGVKFEDLNGDGVRDADGVDNVAGNADDEVGLAGWTINLTGINNQGNPVNLTATTGVNGAYSFSLLPGTYTVYETLVGSWTQSFPQPGAGIVPAPNGTLGYLVTLVSGQQDTNNDFGNYRNATKSGTKFHDLNGDGVRDADGMDNVAGNADDEAGLANWTINIVGVAGDGSAVNTSTTTDANGNYSFSVKPGVYTVSETLQSGWTQSYPDVLTEVGDGGGLDGDWDITLTSGQTDSGNDFGNHRNATKSGTKFHDQDRDGVWDAGEPGLSGWTITLTGTNGAGQAVNLSTTTDSNGNYSFSVPPGTYTVYETLQPNWVQMAPQAGAGIVVAPNLTLGYQVTLTSGQVDNNNHFGNAATPAFTGSKYYDANESSGRDVGEPGLASWTIELYRDMPKPGFPNGDGNFEPNGPFGVTGDDGDPVATAVTDASGNYFLGSLSLPSGRYFIRELVKSGWKQISSPTYYTVMFTQGTAYPTPLDFGNASCVGTLYVPDGPRVVASQRNGLLTLVLSQGSFSVTRVGGAAFDAYNGSGGVLSGVTTVNSRIDAAGQRVDILIGANDYLHAGAHPTAPGTQFTVNITGSGGAGTFSVLNAVNVDVAGSLALQITGTECGELIAVGDDKVDGANSDAKAIYFGTVEGVYNGGANLTSQGIEYDKAIMDAMFGSPTISRVEVAALAGDDIVRVKDEILQQQMLNAGDGNDTVRSGSGKSQVFGGAGIDLLVGGGADDVIYGDAGQDRIFAGAGDDRVFGGLGDDYIAGYLGNDSLLKGEDGNDRISGGDGRDRLYGDAGNDIGYRDATDLLVYQVESVFSVAPPDPVEQALRELVDTYWNDAELTDGDEDAALDTLDELINSILP